MATQAKSDVIIVNVLTGQTGYGEDDFLWKIMKNVAIVYAPEVSDFFGLHLNLKPGLDLIFQKLYFWKFVFAAQELSHTKKQRANRTSLKYNNTGGTGSAPVLITLPKEKTKTSY